MRFRLATLLAVGVCALTSAGHNSLTAIAEWVRRCDQDVLARLACPFDPFTGRFKAPGERTLRDVFARVDPALLTAAGFSRLTTLQARPISATTPDGSVEREQRRALTGSIVTVDALHAQTSLARYLVEDRQAHYLLSVKNNQPTISLSA